MSRIAEARMTWKQFRHNRWFKRWLIVVAFWLVPVMIVVIREAQEEMAYNAESLRRALATWAFSDAQHAAGIPALCHGKADEARAMGCPDNVLGANATRRQEAISEYAFRKRTLMRNLLQAFTGYWVAPAMFLFAAGLVVAGIRRALRRPPVANRSANQ
jgi:hypothetical protein